MEREQRQHQPEEQQSKQYVKPELNKRQKLEEVTEGVPIDTGT